MQKRERGARPGVANYWIRPRVVLVLQTANSCSFNKNVCKKKCNKHFSNNYDQSAFKRIDSKTLYASDTSDLPVVNF